MMKFSEALEAAPKFASSQLFGRGYYNFTETGVEADVLFGAFLGRYGRRGMVRIRDLAAEDTTKACMEVQRGLMRSWPELGRAVSEKERKQIEGLAEPKKGETWVGYICRLNDRYRASWESILGTVRGAGL